MKTSWPGAFPLKHICVMRAQANRERVTKSCVSKERCNSLSLIKSLWTWPSGGPDPGGIKRGRQKRCNMNPLGGMKGMKRRSGRACKSWCGT